MVRRRLARQSATENLKNEQFVELFPELVKEIKESASKARTEREQKEPNKEPKCEATTKEPERVEAAQTDNTLINHLGFCAVIIAFALLAGLTRRVTILGLLIGNILAEQLHRHFCRNFCNPSFRFFDIYKICTCIYML